MAEDRLRDLIDLVLASLDDPVDGRALASRAHFSRDHLDRLLAAAIGESPVGLRRRLLLERAAWRLRAGAATATDVAAEAGYGSLAAFSRAFRRAYGLAPSAFAASGRSVALDAPNGIHFHAPAGLLVHASGAPSAAAGLADRLVGAHLERARELLVATQGRPAADLARPLRPGFVAVWLEGEESSAAEMAARLVRTLEVWVAAITGQPAPEAAPDRAGGPGLLARFDRAAAAFTDVVAIVAERGAWDDGFVDALCEPPESFTYGGVIAHVVTFGAVRNAMLASVLAELGVTDLGPGDPILWAPSRERRRPSPPPHTPSARPH